MSGIVHIGYHKTGTNWFQHHFYPHVRSHTYIRRPLVREALLDIGAFKFDDARATDVLGLDKGTLPILCEEELSGNIHTGGLAGCLSKDLAYRIHSVLPDATIVIFIRNQVSMIASSYKQYIREGGTYSVDAYLNTPAYWHNSGFRPAKAPHFTFDHFDYLPLIHHYQRIFGRENVKVYPFESFVGDSEVFAQQFAKDIHVAVDWKSVRYTSVNAPYRRVTLAVAKVLNRLTYRDVAYKRYWLNIPGFYRKRGKFLRALNKTPLAGPQVSPAHLLGEQWVDFIQNRYKEVNRQITEELKLPLPDLGYPY